MTESDLVERLRAPANWLRQDKGEQWKDAVNRYDRAPFEAAARIEQLEKALRDLLRLVEEDPEEDDPSPYLFDQVCDRARAALEAKP